MRSDFFPFLRVGATVCAAATCFDKPGEVRFSEWRFGDQWETSIMIGRVRRLLQTSCMVQWDDAEIREVDFEHIELHGNSLRAAETLMNLQNEANMENSDGGPRRSTRIRQNKPPAPEPLKDSDDSSVHEPLSRIRPETPAEVGSPSSPSSSSGTKSMNSSRDSAKENASAKQPEGISGRGAGRGRGRGRGRGHRRGRGRGRQAPQVNTNLVVGEVAIDESDESEDNKSDSYYGEESESDTIRAKDGTGFVTWNKMEGRNVDPFVQRGYNRRAEFKMHNYTEKTESDYFESMFPWHLLPEIAALMTARSRLVGFGSEWNVTHGDLIGFLCINFAILVFHTGGPKEDLWLSIEETGAYFRSLFLPANLGQYGRDLLQRLHTVNARVRASNVRRCCRPVRPHSKIHRQLEREHGEHISSRQHYYS